MGNGAIKPEELNGQAVKETDRNYFVHGNVRIIINEHFADDGKSLENIIEESIVRHARYGLNCDLPDYTGISNTIDESE